MLFRKIWHRCNLKTSRGLKFLLGRCKIIHTGKPGEKKKDWAGIESPTPLNQNGKNQAYNTFINSVQPLATQKSLERLTIAFQNGEKTSSIERKRETVQEACVSTGGDPGWGDILGGGVGTSPKCDVWPAQNEATMHEEPNKNCRQPKCAGGQKMKLFENRKKKIKYTSKPVLPTQCRDL